MNTYDFVHLVFFAAGGKIEGRTKLQKMVYFAGVLSNCTDLGYRPHFYGPYSSDVTGAVDRLRGLGFLRQTISSGGAVDRQGFEVARYDYELTDDGKLVAEEKKREKSKEWPNIERSVQLLSEHDPHDYVKLSIAAKTHFMKAKRKELTNLNELEEFSKRFGWKVSSDEINQAFKWLEDVHLLEGTNP